MTQLCTVHPAGSQPPPAVKLLDKEHWCRPCLDAFEKEVKRRLKARGLGGFANKLVVKYAMGRVGKEGRRVNPTKKFG